MVRLVLILAAAVASPAIAAGLEPVWGIHVQRAKAAWEKQCGCSLTITIKPGFTSYDQKGLIRTAAQDLLEIADGACVREEEARAAYCTMRTLVLDQTKAGEKNQFTRSDSTVTVTQTIGEAWVFGLAMTRLLDPNFKQRKFIRENVRPSIEQTQASIKRECGGELRIDLVVSSFMKPRDPEQFGELSAARDSVVDFETISRFCSGEWTLGPDTDAAAIKKAVSRLKTVSISNGPRGKGTQLRVEGTKAIVIEDADENGLSAKLLLEGVLKPVSSK